MKRCKLSSYADNTQIFFAHDDYREVESAINSDLELVDKWYDENGLKRNNSKYQAIVMGKYDATLDFKCENSSIAVTKEFEMLGITIDTSSIGRTGYSSFLRRILISVRRNTLTPMTS